MNHPLFVPAVIPMRLSARAEPPRRPLRETALARALRQIADRRRLAELDDRLLRDLGLTREDVARGVPFDAEHAGHRKFRA